MRWIISIILLLQALPLFAVGTDERTIEPVSLAELAAFSDLVVLARARDTDYFMRRNIPVSGSAYLQVLISYKTPRGSARPGTIIEVYEKGLHAHECYFPNPTVFEEGRRYLLFLRIDPEKGQRYRGMPQGCALDVLVDSENRYALRYPASGINLSDPLGQMARRMEFSDGYAIVDDEQLLPVQRDVMLQAGAIAPFDGPGRQWIYTMGISLQQVRRLMRLDASLD